VLSVNQPQSIWIILPLNLTIFWPLSLAFTLSVCSYFITNAIFSTTQVMNWVGFNFCFRFINFSLYRKNSRAHQTSSDGFKHCAETQSKLFTCKAEAITLPTSFTYTVNCKRFVRCSYLICYCSCNESFSKMTNF